MDLLGSQNLMLTALQTQLPQRARLLSNPNSPEPLNTTLDSSTLLDEEQQFTNYSLSRNRHPHISPCFIRKCCCSCHNTRSFAGWTWSLSLPLLSSFYNTCNVRSCLKSKRASIWISLTRIGIPYAFLATLDVVWNSRHSSISPSLHMKRVVDWDSPIYELIKDMRWNKIEWMDWREKMVHLFEEGKGSPFDILPDGDTLPEVMCSAFPSQK